MTLRTKWRKAVEFEEGNKRKPYDCGTGLEVKAPVGKVTIGIGWNLQDQNLPDSIIEDLFQISTERAWEGAREIFPDLFLMSENRQIAIAQMVFQMGEGGVRKFTRMCDAIRSSEWKRAAIEARNSKWARHDSPGRAARVTAMLEKDIYPY